VPTRAGVLHTESVNASPQPETIPDTSVRAITDDGAFRVIVARTTSTVQEVARLQKASGLNAKTLGDLLTATILFRETMAPDLRVQGILRGAGKRGTLIADSAPGGLTRGLMQTSDQATIVATEGAQLQMMRSLRNGAINQGVVAVPPGGGITQAAMAYMKDSEQVDTMLAVGTVLDDAGNVTAAGGYLVQLLPELGRGPLALMAERLEDFRTIEPLLDQDFTPEWLRDELLYGLPFTALDQTPLSFECWCSQERLLGALSSLDRSEIQAMIDDAEPLEIACDYCNKEYRIQPAKLVGLVTPS